MLIVEPRGSTKLLACSEHSPSSMAVSIVTGSVALLESVPKAVSNAGFIFAMKR